MVKKLNEALETIINYCNDTECDDCLLKSNCHRGYVNPQDIELIIDRSVY